MLSPWGLIWRWKSWILTPPPFLMFQTTPGVQKRYFRHIKNLIAAFQKPDQGIAEPLLYPVTAQRRAQRHTEEQEPSNSLPSTHSDQNPYLQQRRHDDAQGQNNRKVRQVLRGKTWTQVWPDYKSETVMSLLLHFTCRTWGNCSSVPIKHPLFIMSKSLRRDFFFPCTCGTDSVS